MDLKGKWALVTAGHVRLGRAISRALARGGANILFTFRSDDASAAEAQRELEGLGAKVEALRCELGDPAEVQGLIQRVTPFAPSVLINNAAIFPKNDLGDTTAADWDRVMAVNLRAPFLLAQSLGLEMKRRGAGKIVNLGDWAGERPYHMHGYLPYMVSKAGILHLTRTLALELAPAVQVNSVCPGPVLFPEGTPSEEEAAAIRATPLQRHGSPDDVAKAVMLVVAETDFMTGSTL